MAYRRRRKRRGTILDAAAVALVIYYGAMAWTVRQTGLRVERARAAGVPYHAVAPEQSLRLQARVDMAKDAPLQLRLYRRVSGIHLLEHCARVTVRRGWLLYLYPAARPGAAYAVVLTDDRGRWARLDTAALPVAPSPTARLVLRTGPAPWFL